MLWKLVLLKPASLSTWLSWDPRMKIYLIPKIFPYILPSLPEGLLYPAFATVVPRMGAQQYSELTEISWSGVWKPSSPGSSLALFVKISSQEKPDGQWPRRVDGSSFAGCANYLQNYQHFTFFCFFRRSKNVALPQLVLPQMAIGNSLGEFPSSTCRNSLRLWHWWYVVFEVLSFPCLK